MAGRESGAPGVSSDTHGQWISSQAVSFIALELDSVARVQVELVHFAVLHLFGALAAFGRWKQGADCTQVKDSGGAGECWRPKGPIYIRSHVGAGRLHVPLA